MAAPFILVHQQMSLQVLVGGGAVVTMRTLFDQCSSTSSVAENFCLFLAMMLDLDVSFELVFPLAFEIAKLASQGQIKVTVHNFHVFVQVGLGCGEEMATFTLENGFSRRLGYFVIGLYVSL